MKIFNYDKDTFEYLFTSDAQKNPLKDGEYLYPKFSTTIQPPPLKVNETALFIDGIWKIVSDFRGYKVVNIESGEVSVINMMGEIPDGFMLYEDYIASPEYKKHLEEIEKETKIAEILNEINTLDEKRIRAVCEPEIRDLSTGETWLEYYNKQIVVLRQKLAEVDYGT